MTIRVYFLVPLSQFKVEMSLILPQVGDLYLLDHNQEGNVN